MKTCLLIFCFGFFRVAASFGQASNPAALLAARIDSLYAVDQNTAKIKPPDSAAAAYRRVIKSNFPLVKKILLTYGYPGYRLVGEESSKRYFLLVQHSDFDAPFQRQALKLMQREVSRNNASGQQYAALIDRIEVTQGKPQVYGTQVLMSGNTQPKPCLDPENLDKRRKAVGLEPIAEYLKKCNAFFYELNPKEKSKAAGR